MAASPDRALCSRRLRRARRRAAVLTLTGAAFLGACAGRDPVAPVDTDTFVEAVVAARSATAETAVPEDFQARRAEVLREVGVTEDALRAYVAAWGRDTDHMHQVWSRIRERLATAGEDALEDDVPEAEAPLEAAGEAGPEADAGASGPPRLEDGARPRRPPTRPRRVTPPDTAR